MTLMPRLNAFVVMQSPIDSELLEWGRVLAMNIDVQNQEVTLKIAIENDIQCSCVCPPWKLIHCHPQPLLEFVTVDGKRIKLDPADDSLAWRLTGEAIARAMTDFTKKEPRR